MDGAARAAGRGADRIVEAERKWRDGVTALVDPWQDARRPTATAAGAPDDDAQEVGEAISRHEQPKTIRRMEENWADSETRVGVGLGVNQVDVMEIFPSGTVFSFPRMGHADCSRSTVNYVEMREVVIGSLVCAALISARSQ